MSSQQRQAVLRQQAANDEAHQAKINEQRALQDSKVKKFDGDLAGLDRDLEDNLRRAKNVATDHQDVMNKLTREENEIVREKTSMHAELMKEMGKNANRDIEALQKSEADNQASMMAYQSSEKKRMEENRRQADKEAAEKIEDARRETAKTDEIARAQRREQTEYVRMVEKDQMEEIGVMKRELLENSQQEFGRKQLHAENMEKIGFLKIGARMGMDTAEERMRKNREAQEQVTRVSNEIVSLQRTINEIHSKVKVAKKLQKPKLLMSQYSMLVRLSEASRTKKSSVQTKMTDLINVDIDDKNEDRKSIMEIINKDLEKLNDMGETINMLATSEADMDFVDSLFESVETAVKVMESVKSTWDSLPPVDQTNLMHQQFLATTGTLMDGAKMAALKGNETKEIEN